MADYELNIYENRIILGGEMARSQRVAEGGPEYEEGCRFRSVQR